MTTTDTIPTAAAAPKPLADRLRGLQPNVAALLRQASQRMRAGQLKMAEQSIAGAEALAPNQAEVRRTRGLWLNHAGRPQEARALVEQLLFEHPEDPALWNDLGGSRRGCGDYEGAFAAWQRACELNPEFAIGWFNLARNLTAQAWIEEALAPLEKSVALAPDNQIARTIYADVLVNLGHLDKAREQYREALRQKPTIGAAWWGLANIKTVRLTDAETAQLVELLARSDVAERDRIAMGCALAKSYEDRGRYEEAFATLLEANTRRRALEPWSAASFSATVNDMLAAFVQPHARAADSQLGSEIIFIVSLPRAGSTLTEQIFSAHPEVEGASELPDLGAVLRDESKRRGSDFPRWVAAATAQDWTRLGAEYLSRTSRWRRKKSRSTDKMPNNWFFIGAIRAMLPGARIVDVRRDPVETCWSTYKQMFTGGNEFSYDLKDTAAFWRDYDRAMRQWHAQAPGHVREQSYERLVADTENEVRALLDFCDLPFDPACLRWHEAERSVRTASAAQVREPMRRDTARSAHYGALLDPLRKALSTTTNAGR